MRDYEFPLLLYFFCYWGSACGNLTTIFQNTVCTPKLRIHINTHTLALWKRGSFCGQDHEHSDCRIKQPHPMTREHIIIHIRDKYCTSIPPEGLWVPRGGTYFPRPGEILPLTWSLAGPAHRPCSLQWDTSIGTYTFNQNVNQNELIYYSGRLDSS